MSFSILGKWKKNTSDDIEIKKNQKNNGIDILCKYKKGNDSFESIGTIINPHKDGIYEIGDRLEVIWTDTEDSNGNIVGKLVRSSIIVKSSIELQRDIGQDYCCNDTFFPVCISHHDYCNPWRR